MRDDTGVKDEANVQFDIESLTCMAHVSQDLKDPIPLFKQPS